VAAEDLIGVQGVAALENAAEEAVAGLTDEPVWPVLRRRLLLLATSGIDPIAQLRNAVDTRELESADDQAAVLGWGLDDTDNQNRFRPLPWLPAIPQRLHKHQTWGPHLAARAATIAELADRVRDSVDPDELPGWAHQRLGQPPSRVVEDIEVWRAAMAVNPEDQRPTGPLQRHKTARGVATQARRGYRRRSVPRVAGVGTVDRANRANGKKRRLRTHSGRPTGRTLTCRSERHTAPAHRSNRQTIA
jgi:hypothetical protein